MAFLHASRVIVLVDMDCFYCQVEENLNQKLIGKPIAVVQYNQWQGGGIIAVNYAARDKGVTRHMRGNEAKAKCPDIALVQVPCVRGKADISKYRDAGKRVADALQTFTDLLERASVDEAYLDITDAVVKRIENSEQITIDKLQNTHIVGCKIEDFIDNTCSNNYLVESDLKLAMGGVIAEEIRAAVYNKTGYRCSAGVAHNKVLAKLACGLHKPNQQTILPQDNIRGLYENLPLTKIRSLGGKFGIELMRDLGIKMMGELIKFSEKDLVQRYDEKTGSWLYKIARGIDVEPVTTRLVSKSIGCCKKFPGRTALVDDEDVTHWLSELSEELSERLEKDLEENNRRAKQMVVSYVQAVKREDVSGSRTHVLNSYEPKRIAADAYEVIKKNCLRSDKTFHLKFLGISAGKFEDNKNVQDISSYFITKSKTNLESKDVTNKCGSIVSFIKNMDSYENKTEVVDNSSKLSENSLDSSHDSVFSAETVIINYDEKELPPYWEENCSELSPTFAREISCTAPHQSESDPDSITDEMFCLKRVHSESEVDTLRPSSASYFSSFFDKLQDEKLKKSPAERNFDTSRHLQDDESEMNNDESNEPGCSYSIDDSKELCKDCNKLILTSDLISHMDYHFALKLVRDEAHIYATNKTIAVETKQKKKKSIKRKHVDEKCGKLTSFLQSNTEDTVTDGLSETCSECSKKIHVNDVLSHMDYHAAKKLHLQINSVKACSTQSMKVNKSKRDTKNKNLPSVSSFFKPL